MKKFTKAVLYSAFLILNAAFVTAQINTENGVVNSLPPASIYANKNQTVTNLTSVVTPCNGANTFWGVEDITLTIKEFSISGNTLTATGNTITGTQP